MRGRRGEETLGVVGTHVASVVADVGLRLNVLGGNLALCAGKMDLRTRIGVRIEARTA